MEQLLKITTIPISIEFKVNNARVERSSGTAQVEIARDKRGLSMKSRPIQLDMDTFEARNSVVPTTMRSIEQYAQQGINGAYEATAKFAEEGNMLLNIHLKQNTLSQIARDRMGSEAPYDFNVGFLPSAPPNINWTPGDLSIQYEMDKLNFDWKFNQGDFKFIPGNIEFNIKEYPRVIIEYVGSPIYVPPSADPDYEPIDMKA